MDSPVQIGETAPDFILVDQDRNEVSFSSCRGRKVVLAFYPLDFSPTCTNEHETFVRDLQIFRDHGAAVLGISVDSSWTHKAFAEKLGIQYPLLADFHPKGAVAKKFGLYNDSLGFSERATVIVDEQGVIRQIIKYDLGTQRDNQEILTALQG